MDAPKKIPEAGKVLNFETFDGGMNIVLSILTQDISAAWRNVAEWQKDQSHLPQIGKGAFKIHSYSVTPITMNSPLMPNGVPAMMVVVIMEKMIFPPLLKNQ